MDTRTVIPAMLVTGANIPEAWERSVLRLWEEGVRVRTEYDRPGNPESRDATMTVVVDDPMSEPRIHLAFPGGIEDLEKYRQEVVHGVHDHWILPEEGKWTYTYHQRLFSYEVKDDLFAIPHNHGIEKIRQGFGVERTRPARDDEGMWLITVPAVKGNP